MLNMRNEFWTKNEYSESYFETFEKQCREDFQKTVTEKIISNELR